MLKLSWKTINDAGVVSALISLNKNPKLDGKLAYRVGRICLTAQKEMVKASNIEREMLLEATLKDPADPKKSKLDECGQPIFTSPTAQKEMEDKFSKLLEETHVEIKVHPLEYEHICTQGGLNGQQLCALDPLMTGQPGENEDA